MAGGINMYSNLIEEQKNVLSSPLLKFYKKNYHFGLVVMSLFSGIGAVVLYVFVLYSIEAVRGLLIFIVPFIVALCIYIGERLSDMSIADMIRYYQQGICIVRRSGRRFFLKWEDIREIRPLGAYGKIRVPDYMLFFKKPFPGNTPVSAEVGKKIEEYLREFREKGYIEQSNL